MKKSNPLKLIRNTEYVDISWALIGVSVLVERCIIKSYPSESVAIKDAVLWWGSCFRAEGIHDVWSTDDMAKLILKGVEPHELKDIEYDLVSLGEQESVINHIANHFGLDVLGSREGIVKLVKRN